MAGASVLDLLRRPLVVAPMAGGPSTAELVIAAAGAGAVGFLAAGYKTPAAMLAEIAAVRAATPEPFGVNVFVPGAPSGDAAAVRRYLGSLHASAEAVGAALAEPVWDDDGFGEKVTGLLADPPPLVSFTFGCPPPEMIAAFQQAGTVVAVTVTSPGEAAAAAAAGADALCVQGYEAGAHRGTFAAGSSAAAAGSSAAAAETVTGPDRGTAALGGGTGGPGRGAAGAGDDLAGRDYGLLCLIGEVAAVTSLPQLAAGGIMGPRQVDAVLAAGAAAAQCGTAFLRCPESGAHPVHKAALADPRYPATALTRAFSGRWARGLVNEFVRRHAGAPAAYPEINNATRPLRAAAAAKGDPERMSLWAGQGYRAAMDRPAGEIIEWLAPPTR